MTDPSASVQGPGRRLRAAGRAGGVVVLVSALAATVVPPAHADTDRAAAARVGSPGSVGIGDRLFPQLGNGGYDVRSYDLTLRYPKKDPKQEITGDVRLVARATQDLSRFDLDFDGVSLKDVMVNGRPATFARSAEELVVTPASVLRKGRSFLVTVRGFVARPVAPNPSGSTILPFVYTTDGTVISAQPDGAHTIFPS